MNGVQGLMDALRKGVKDTRERQEGKAQRGVIQGGRVRIGSRSYPFKAVVDCSTEDFHRRHGDHLGSVRICTGQE